MREDVVLTLVFVTGLGYGIHTIFFKKHAETPPLQTEVIEEEVAVEAVMLYQKQDSFQIMLHKAQQVDAKDTCSGTVY